MVDKNEELHSSHKLVRCFIVSREGVKKLRYVEIETFRLWEFLMTEKHGQKVIEPVPCLWIDECQFEEHSDLYSHSSNVMPVNRVAVTIFDSNFGFEHIFQRYVYAFDTDELIQHIRLRSQKMYEANNFDIQIIRGYSIERWVHDDKLPFILGLSD